MSVADKLIRGRGHPAAMVEPMDALRALGFLEGLAIMAVGGILMRHGGHMFAARILGVNLLFFGSVPVVVAVPGFLGVPEAPRVETVAWILRTFALATIVMFFVSYPRPTLSSGRRWFLAGIAATPFVVVAGTFLARDAVLLPDGRPAVALQRIVHEMLLAGQVLAFLIMVPQWIRAGAGAFRAQLRYAMLPIVVFGLNDMAPVVHAAATRWDETLGPRGVVLPLAAVILLGIIAVAATSLLRMLRERAPRGDDAFVLLWILAMVPASFLQLSAPPLHEDRLFLHFVVDGIVWLGFFYGVARNQVLDIDLRLKWTVRQSTVAAAFVAVLFVASEAAQTVLSQEAGTLVGLLAAGALVFALAPLQRVAERVSDRAFPNVDATATYLNYRKLEIYKVALENMWRDGVIQENEAATLAALRRELGVSEEEHALLERDVRLRRASTG
ncbi:MAG: hypothetical protein ACT4PT_07060 [Methanobacteriota archaeon]